MPPPARYSNHRSVYIDQCVYIANFIWIKISGSLGSSLARVYADCFHVEFCMVHLIVFNKRKQQTMFKDKNIGRLRVNSVTESFAVRAFNSCYTLYVYLNIYRFWERMFASGLKFNAYSFSVTSFFHPCQAIHYNMLHSSFQLYKLHGFNFNNLNRCMIKSRIDHD